MTDETGKAIKDALASIQQAIQQQGQGDQGGGVSISVETDPEALTTLSQSVVYFLAPGTWTAFSPAVTVPAGKFGIAKYGTAWAVTVLGGGELASAIAAMTAAEELTGDEVLPMGSGESVTVQQLAEFAEGVVGGNAAHVSGETADQSKLASIGKVMELIGSGRRVEPITAWPQTPNEALVYLIDNRGGLSPIPIGTESVPIGSTAYAYHNGAAWVVVEDEGTPTPEAIMAALEDRLDTADGEQVEDATIPTTEKVQELIGNRSEVINGDSHGGFDISEIRDKAEYYLQDGVELDADIDSYDDSGYLMKKIRSIGTQPSEGEKRLIYMADAHYQEIDTTQGDRQNSRKWPYIMRAVKSACNIPWAVYGGDAYEGTPTAVAGRGGYVGARMLSEFMSDWWAVNGDRCSVCVGNHDSNNAGFSHYGNPTASTNNIEIEDVVLTDILVDRMTGYIAQKHYDDEGLALVDSMDYASGSGTYFEDFATNTDKKNGFKALIKTNYYVDDSVNKIRHIVLNSNAKTIEEANILSDGKSTTYGALIISQFLLAKALGTLPAGYDAIVEIHEFPTSAIAIGYIANTIKSWRDKKSDHSFAKNDASGVTSNWYNKHELGFRSLAYYDFSNANSGHVIILAAHLHADNQRRVYEYSNTQGNLVWGTSAIPSEGISEGEILLINTQKSCFGRYESSGDSPMVRGTITETAFDVVKWVPGTGVDCVRIGYGNDRHIDYAY